MMDELQQMSPNEHFIVALYFVKDIEAYSKQVNTAIAFIEIADVFCTTPSQ